MMSRWEKFVVSVLVVFCLSLIIMPQTMYDIFLSILMTIVGERK